MRGIYFTIAILFCLLFTKPAVAQTSKYFPFPDSGAEWSGSYSFCYGCYIEYPQPTYFSFGFYFKMTHDTIITSKSYHLINFANTWVEIESHNISLYINNYNLGPPFKEETVGALREDS